MRDADIWKGTRKTLWWGVSVSVGITGDGSAVVMAAVVSDTNPCVGFGGI